MIFYSIKSFDYLTLIQRLSFNGPYIFWCQTDVPYIVKNVAVVIVVSEFRF